jgi:hypothetical protein
VGGGGRGADWWFSGGGMPPSNSGLSPAGAGEYHQFRKQKNTDNKNRGHQHIHNHVIENFAGARPARIAAISFENRFRGVTADFDAGPSDVLPARPPNKTMTPPIGISVPELIGDGTGRGGGGGPCPRGEFYHGAMMRRKAKVPGLMP